MLYLKKLTADDGGNIYEMLREIPADENGVMNTANGKSCGEFEDWLKKSA